MVLDWMSIAIMGRNETYLVLNGRKGIGKGVFCELLSSLVGRENYSEAPKSLLTSQFNASLDQKRLLIFDEFKVGKSEHSLLKRYINRFQAIEKKGIDALNAVETYNSFIISNNDLTDMYVEYDDRRLSIPDLNTKDFSSALSKEDIKQFLKDMESAEFIAPFGQYLVDRYAGAKEKSFNYISGKRFNELVYNSLHDWKKFLVGKILSNEFARYKISALRREFTAEGKTYFPTDPRKIEEFFVNYKHDGRQIAEVVIENGRDSYLHPIKEDDAF